MVENGVYLRRWVKWRKTNSFKECAFSFHPSNCLHSVQNCGISLVREKPITDGSLIKFSGNESNLLLQRVSQRNLIWRYIWNYMYRWNAVAMSSLSLDIYDRYFSSTFFCWLIINFKSTPIAIRRSVVPIQRLIQSKQDFCKVKNTWIWRSRLLMHIYVTPV